MATILLAFAGSQLGAAGSFAAVAGAAVGTALGSYIDREYLFPVPDIEQPRVGDLRAQAGSEGMPLNYAIGPECRVPGKVVYAGPRFPGTSGNYLIDLCQGPLEEDEFVSEIYANGQLIYQQDPDIEIVSSLLRVDEIYYFEEIDLGFKIVSEVGGPSLSDVVLGQLVTVSGFAWAGNNGVFRATSSGASDSVDGEQFLWLFPDSASGGDFQVVAAGPEITLTQDLSSIQVSTFSELRQYRGTFDQSPDDVVTDDYGPGVSPGRYGRACIAIVGLDKNKFGGSTPNFEVSLRERVSMTVADALDELMQRSGFDPSEWDSSAITGSFRGIVAEEPIDSKGLLQSVMMAHRVMAREVEGQLIFYPRDASDTVAVIEADLGSSALGSNPPSRKVGFEDNADADIPSRVDLQFTNSDDGLQQGNAQETHHGLQRYSEEVLRARTPVTLSEQEAGAFARSLLLDAHASRQVRSTTLPTEYLDLCEGDVWTSTVDGKAITSIATRVEMGADGVVRIEGTQEQPHIQRIDPAEVDKEGAVNGDGEGVPLSLYLNLAVEEFGPENEDQASRPGIHWGFLDFGATQAYTVGALYISRDDASYTDTLQASPSALASLAFVSDGGYQGGPISVEYIDRVSRITMSPFGDWVPQSQSAASQESGNGKALFRREVISWQTSTDNGDGTFTVSNLLRGLLGTEQYVNDHNGTQSVVPLSDFSFTTGGVLATGDFGATINWKGVGAGWDESEVGQLDRTASLRTMTPFRPYSLRATRWETDEVHDEDDIELRWRRQSRRPRPMFSGEAGNDQPENVESYEVTVVNSSGNAAPNSPYTVPGNGSEVITWTYTALMAAADDLAAGGGLGQDFSAASSKAFSVAQVGISTIGAGPGRAALVSTSPGTYQPTAP